MFRFLAVFLFWGVLSGAHAEPAQTPPRVGFSIIRTAKLTVREGLLYAGGSFFKQATTNFSAILVKHGDDLFLFDSGLGSDVARQYRQDMPLWQRPFFKYDDPVSPARSQLDRAGVAPIRTIILSHSHWDHASGLTDFPAAQVWVARPEFEAIRHPAAGVGGAWPSQVGSKAIAWRSVAFAPHSYQGFDGSFDLYGDGKVVLVPLYGHTAGSIGLFLTVDSGRRYFFTGDASWTAQALKQGKPKFWAARLLVDHDTEQTDLTAQRIRAVMEREPELTVVPAHDGAVQSALGYFPHWVK